MAPSNTTRYPKMRCSEFFGEEFATNTPAYSNNFWRFIDAITPRIPMTPLRSQHQTSDDSERFPLRKFWGCYEEWSSYGAATPFLLENGSEITHYFHPTLSAIQLYRINPDGPENSEGEYESLYFQYNETESPYRRKTLFQKVFDISQSVPAIMESTDVSSSSWVSVAWYPICEIPTTRNIDEMSTCFLTYHLLSHFKGDASVQRGEISVAPFGVASYLMPALGGRWANAGQDAEQHQIIEFQKRSNSWLENVHFYHSDFRFYLSKSGHS